jgi:hypothetical protein
VFAFRSSKGGDEMREYELSLLIKEILSTYTERKKIHECSSRGEGKDEDKERE